MYWLLLVGCRSILMSNREDPPYFNSSEEKKKIKKLLFIKLNKLEK